VTDHLNEDAELYALGLTDLDRTSEIEAHLTECVPCRDRVIAAEAAAASLAATLPPMPDVAVSAAPPRASTASRGWWAPLATAAAFLFAATAVVEGGLARSAGDRVQRTDVALTALASSHFGHTTLTSSPGVIAKVIYSRDGSWAYVVANGTPSGAHLVARESGTQHDLGPLDAGRPATLFVHQPGKADEFTVVTGTTIIAHGKPMY